jgi:DNA-binding response OmpR family regulator
MIYRFDEFELDTSLFELRRSTAPCPMEPQVFNVPAFLVEHHDRVVTNSAGIASISLKLSQKPGNYTVSADYAGDSRYFGDNSGTTPYKIGK